MSWEWGAYDMGVRRLPPPLGWVGVGGSTSANWLGSFTGHGVDGGAAECLRATDTGPGRPSSNCGAFFGQQGGWMATRRQVQRLHERWCDDGFLPPPATAAAWFPRGNVEFFSGGIQIFGPRCRVARIVALDSVHFGDHLVLHSTGNKQRKRPGHQGIRSAAATFRALRVLRSFALAVASSAPGERVLRGEAKGEAWASAW